MVKLNLILIYLFFSSVVYSQTVSELKKKLETTSGVEKAQILIQLSNKTINADVKQAIEYAEDAEKIAEELKNDNLSANANLVLAQAYFNNNNYDKSITSGKKSADYFKAKNPKNYAAVESVIGRAYLKKKEYNESINNLKNAYEVYLEQNDKKNIASITSEIADVYDLKNQTKETIKWYELSKNEYQTLNNPKKILQVTYNLAVAYNNFGNYKKAQDLFSEALKIAQDNGFSNDEAKIRSKMEVVDKNSTAKTTSKTSYEEEQEQITETYIKNIEQEKALTLEEIEKLSKENQLIQFRIKAQKDDYEKRLLAEQVEKIKAETLANKAEAMAIKEKEDRKKAELQLMNEKLKSEKKAAENKQLIIGIGGLFLVLALLFIGFLSKQKHNKVLKSKNKEINQQKTDIELKNQHISSSIDYAKRIQEAILPSSKQLSILFPQSFLILLPKDKVSGDFFWIYEKNNAVYVAVADCTGHGVPGAFVSIIMSSILDGILKDADLEKPSSILNEASERLTGIIKDKGYAVDEFKDGMDIAMIKINKAQNELTFAGAKNPIYIIRDKELVQLKAVKRSVETIKETNPLYSFTDEKWTLQANDKIYLFSDGFADQKGGKDNNKYYYPPFRNLLLETSSLNTEDQKNKIISTFNQFKGNYEQIDDVTILSLWF